MHGHTEQHRHKKSCYKLALAESSIFFMYIRQVSDLDGNEARRRLVALQKAAAAGKSTAKPAEVRPLPAQIPTPSRQPFPSAANFPIATTMAAPAQQTATTAATTIAAPANIAATAAVAAIEMEVEGESKSEGRRISTAKHLKGHVVVLGFPPRPSHMECFLRPLTG